MAKKKHRGFGDNSEVQNFYEVRQTKNFDNEKRKIIIKLFGLAKC